METERNTYGKEEYYPVVGITRRLRGMVISLVDVVKESWFIQHSLWKAYVGLFYAVALYYS